jgi:hypothetical protein
MNPKNNFFLFQEETFKENVLAKITLIFVAKPLSQKA